MGLLYPISEYLVSSPSLYSILAPAKRHTGGNRKWVTNVEGLGCTPGPQLWPGPFPDNEPVDGSSSCLPPSQIRELIKEEDIINPNIYVPTQTWYIKQILLDVKGGTDSHTMRVEVLNNKPSLSGLISQEYDYRYIRVIEYCWPNGLNSRL